MTLTLVSHSPCPAALYGALAASAAQAQNAVLMHLPATFAAAHGADSQQMVAAQGALVPSGLLWYERLTGREILPASTVHHIVEAAHLGAVVVPWHAEFQVQALYDALIEQANTAGVPIRHLHGRQCDGHWCLVDEHGEPSDYGRWWRDTFGRWVNTTTAPFIAPKALQIALLGTQEDQLDVYPATLAALGDAAQAAGIDLRVRFVPPAPLDATLLETADGIVLPGGSDMGNVAGQIAAARYALAHNIPIVGLCLGMQSMTTAFAQTLPGLELANMAEAAPQTPLYSFVPMADTPGLPEHRLGIQTLRVPGDHLAQNRTIRCNHRFMLNPVLTGSLLEAGLNISATDATGQIADAIEWPQHVFYRAMQGHPEQGSNAGHPHPLLEDFLRAAQAGKDSLNDRPTLHTINH